MTTSIYNPHVEGHQHSACRLKIIKGTNIIQVGWRVNQIALHWGLLIFLFTYLNKEVSIN